MGSKSLEKFLKEGLNDLKSKGLYNEINTITGQNGPVIEIEGKKLVN